jgi:hypothetical protein
MTHPDYLYGYMSFMAEDPLCAGISPQPAFAPQEKTGIPTSAEECASRYNGQKTYLQAIADCADMFDPEYQDVPDIVLRVRVDNIGQLSVYDDCSDEPFVTFTDLQIYDAFGMKP